jgi:hypothetical protein
MASTVCKTCGGTVKVTAPICPSCGESAISRGSWWRRYAFGADPLAILGVVLGTGTGALMAKALEFVVSHHGKK